MAETPSSASEIKSINKDVIEAINLLAHGKRNILCGEISQAVTQLQEACRILGSEYGELADECADAYMWYGKALLELSRIEGGVLGDAIPGADSDKSGSSSEGDSSDEQNSTVEGKEEGDDDPEEEEDAVMSEDLYEEEAGAEIKGDDSATEPHASMKCPFTIENAGPEGTRDQGSNAQERVAEESKPGAMGDASKVSTRVEDADVEAKKHEAAADAPSEKEGPSQNNEAGEGQASSSCCTLKPEDNEDISNLQLAWEMLELSKIIYQRHDRDDTRLKLAETHLRLGEIGMETEQYDQAISDLTECLHLQKRILVPEDRRLAETLYQLGLACTYCRKYDTAVGHYQSAVDVIQAKIAHLGKVVAGVVPPDPTENSDGFYTPLELAQREIEELRELLPDISAKIDDVRDEQGEAEKVKVLMEESVAPSGMGHGSCSQTADGNSELAFASTSRVFPSTVTQPVHNISHLVRKKRKSEEDVKQESDAVKRQKVANATTVVSEQSSNKKTDAVPDCLDAVAPSKNQEPHQSTARQSDI